MTMDDRIVRSVDDRWTLHDEAAALAWCQARNDEGIRCLLDPLGRYSRTEGQIKEAMDEHLALIDHIAGLKLDASITVKLSTLGGTLNREMTISNASALCRRCAERDVRFELDMEGQKMVNLTLDVAERCQAIAPVTLALQAYLDRTPRDLIRMLDAGVMVRLVKGAYSGNLSDFEMIQEVFKDLVEEILGRDVSFCVATHDLELIRWVKHRCQDKDLIEYGFLKGLADSTKIQLAADGWHVAEYVPYGLNKEGYETRRKTYLRRLEELGRSPAP